jgi:hypothetical protein
MDSAKLATLLAKIENGRGLFARGPHESNRVEAELSKNPCYPLKISLFFGKNSLLILNKNLRRNRCGAHVSSLCDDLRQG